MVWKRNKQLKLITTVEASVPCAQNLRSFIVDIFQFHEKVGKYMSKIGVYL